MSNPVRCRSLEWVVEVKPIFRPISIRRLLVGEVLLDGIPAFLERTLGAT